MTLCCYSFDFVFQEMPQEKGVWSWYLDTNSVLMIKNIFVCAGMEYCLVVWILTVGRIMAKAQLTVALLTHYFLAV